MADLYIKHKGGDNYLFISIGCPLKYFVIWAEGEEPKWENVYGDGNYYQLNYNLDRNKTYNFHVYDGQNSKDFRGKMRYTTGINFHDNEDEDNDKNADYDNYNYYNYYYNYYYDNYYYDNYYY